MLAQHLFRLASDYVHERNNAFTGSHFAEFVRHDIPMEAKRQLQFEPVDYLVKGSVGQGNWAAVPWLAFLDPLITKTATKEFYVVYLINPDSKVIYLSINQGATAVTADYGRKQGLIELKRRAENIAVRVSEFSKLFDTSPIDLGSTADLPMGYEAGHSFGRAYNTDDLNEKVLIDDLLLMLKAYRDLVAKGGTTPIDLMLSETPGKDIEEVRRYRLSLRIERAPNVRKEVLKCKPPICEGCGLEPALDYAFKGPSHKVPLDIHHALPLNELREGETRRYKIPDDFMVLCPNCHRVIHSLDNPSDLTSLKSRIRFKHMRRIEYP